MMDRILGTLLGILLVPVFFFGLYKLVVFALPYAPQIAIGIMVLGVIASLFGFSSSEPKKSNPIEGSYDVYTTDPDGTTTYKRQTFSKNHWHSS